jgi:hypothetical protein
MAEQTLVRRDAWDVPASSLHPDWMNDWGATIKAPRNRKAILDNPRLAHRPGADLARLLGVPPMEAASASARDQHAYQALLKAPARFTQLVGLASLAPMLATIIDGVAFRALQAEFSVEDLKIALACRNEAPARIDTEIDRSRLKLVVETTGPRLVQGWADRLPEQLRGRIRLLLPKSLVAAISERNQPIINHDPSKVIQRVAELMLPPG